jgi:hypothetical protein
MRPSLYEVPESEQCPCCGRDDVYGDHYDGCANTPTADEAIEALAALWWDGREDDTADDAARVNAMAERFIGVP